MRPTKKKSDPAGILNHINNIRVHISKVVQELQQRKLFHDLSKTKAPEWSLFTEISPVLSSLEYGTKEYMDKLKELKPAIQHHFERNRHHPEHFKNGVSGMTLIDVLEMLCDWKAANERPDSIEFYVALDRSFGRFEIDGKLRDVIVNTAVEMGWMPELKPGPKLDARAEIK